MTATFETELTAERDMGVAFTDTAPAFLDTKNLNWAVQDEVLRNLWAQNLSPDFIANHLNRSVAAIMTRAARLGLPRRFAPGRKRVMRSPAELRERQMEIKKQTRSYSREQMREALEPKEGIAMRVCLMCVNPFQSQGRHNRICPKCKGPPEYEAGSRLPDLDFGA